MKFLPLLLAVFALTLSARADGDNWVENGDFADGITHWYGGGRSPADFASDNPLNGNDPFTSKGLIIPLKASDWTKVAQDFKGKVSSGVMRITYMVSKDFAFSTKPEDYKNMPGHIGYNSWKPFDTVPGKWIVFLSDFGSAHGTYYQLLPKGAPAVPQTYTGKVTGMTPFDNKTITLAFPPGTGMVVILNVSLTSE